MREWIAVVLVIALVLCCVSLATAGEADYRAAMAFAASCPCGPACECVDCQCQASGALTLAAFADEARDSQGNPYRPYRAPVYGTQSVCRLFNGRRSCTTQSVIVGYETRCQWNGRELAYRGGAWVEVK